MFGKGKARRVITLAEYEAERREALRQAAKAERDEIARRDIEAQAESHAWDDPRTWK